MRNVPTGPSRRGSARRRDAGAGSGLGLGETMASRPGVIIVGRPVSVRLAGDVGRFTNDNAETGTGASLAARILTYAPIVAEAKDCAAPAARADGQASLTSRPDGPTLLIEDDRASSATTKGLTVTSDGMPTATCPAAAATSKRGEVQVSACVAQTASATTVGPITSGTPASTQKEGGKTVKISTESRPV